MADLARESDNARIARRFVAAVEAGTTGAPLAAFFHEKVTQHELPNLVFPSGARRDKAALLASAEKGRTVLRSQRYEITNLVESGSRIAIEMSWRAELAVPLKSLRPGDFLTGQFAFFLEIEDGLIVGLRNYDCYDPF